MIKTIDSIQYHVWSDALHARQLARGTTSDWDRGAYVRWAIQTAWTAFENVCMDALATTNLGMRFKENFDSAVSAQGLPAVDWGQGVWQRVMKVYKVRIEFVHVKPTISHARLLMPVSDADEAITVLRDGIDAVCKLVGNPRPAWAADDADRGWVGGHMELSSGVHATLLRGGATEDDPQAVRITYVQKGQEHVSEIASPGTPHDPLIDRFLEGLTTPVEAVRAYRGAELLEERIVNVR